MNLRVILRVAKNLISSNSRLTSSQMRRLQAKHIERDV